MSSSVILDTNAVSDLLNNVPAFLEQLKKYEEYLIPVVVMGELFFMVENSGRVLENRQRIEDFLAAVRVIDIDLETARHYARVRLMLKRKGRPIPIHDYWIAALVLQHQLPLLSRDSHFEDIIEGLQVITWPEPNPPFP